MPEWVRVGRVAGRLSNLADAGGLRVEADYVVLTAVGEEFAIDIAGAADGFFRRGTFGGGAVIVAVISDTDFVFDMSLA